MNSFELLFILAFAIAGSCASRQCPGHSIIHPASGLPLECHISEDCASATCTTSPFSSPSGLIALHLMLCSKPVQVAISGSFHDSRIRFPKVRIGGSTRLPISPGAGELEVINWTSTNTTLHFSTRVHSADAIHPLFNATLSLNQTQDCISAQPDSSSTVPADSSNVTPDNLQEMRRPGASPSSLQETGVDIKTEAPFSSLQEAPMDRNTGPTFSPSIQAFTSASTCETLQVIARSSSVCQVGPRSCRALQCDVNGYYRINVTILPCGETPAVALDINYLVEGLTLLHKVYTKTERETVYLLGETRLFDMAVFIDHSPKRDHITLQLELIYPWEETFTVFPASIIPCKDSPPQTQEHPPLVHGRSQPGPQEQQPLPILAISMIVSAILVVILAMVVVGIVCLQRATKLKTYEKKQPTNFNTYEKIPL